MARPAPTRSDDDYLTVLDVAALWHCDKETVYRAIYDGELSWVDMRGKGASRARIRIRRSAAHAYMAARERTAGVLPRESRAGLLRRRSS